MKIVRFRPEDSEASREETPHVGICLGDGRFRSVLDTPGAPGDEYADWGVPDSELVSVTLCQRHEDGTISFFTPVSPAFEGLLGLFDEASDD